MLICHETKWPKNKIFEKSMIFLAIINMTRRLFLNSPNLAYYSVSCMQIEIDWLNWTKLTKLTKLNWSTYILIYEIIWVCPIHAFKVKFQSLLYQKAYQIKLATTFTFNLNFYRYFCISVQIEKSFSIVVDLFAWNAHRRLNN